MSKRARSTTDPFRALAAPTRRKVLELLRANRAVTAGAIANKFPHVSRPAIARHLRVLRNAGLVHAKAAGREQIYSLDAEPLHRLQEEWLAQFNQIADSALTKLKQRIERPPRGD
jgi:DNA-binding transcriptional ArsR family regulator